MITELREEKSKEAKELINKYILLKENKGLLSSDVSKITGLGKSVVTRIEKGINIPKIDTFIIMLDALGYTLTIKSKNIEEHNDINIKRLKKLEK